MPCVDKKDAGAAEGQTDLLAVTVIQRPFWAAPRVRRKFGAQRRIAQGRLCRPRALKSPEGGAARGRGAQKEGHDLRRVLLFGAARQIRTADLILTNGILLIIQYFLAWNIYLYHTFLWLHCILSLCPLTPYSVALVVK